MAEIFASAGKEPSLPCWSKAQHDLAAAAVGCWDEVKVQLREVTTKAGSAAAAAGVGGGVGGGGVGGAVGTLDAGGGGSGAAAGLRGGSELMPIPLERVGASSSDGVRSAQSSARVWLG